MRIALFSDIHANLPAFEKLLESLDTRVFAGCIKGIWNIKVDY